MNRDLHLIEHKDGATEAEFMKFPAYGTPHYVRRLLTMREAARAKEIIAKSKRMDRIREALESMSVCYKIRDNSALVEFWTDTAGQDIPTEFDYNGTAKDFVRQFKDRAESYDPDEEVEIFANMRGQRGVPNTIREILDDCEEAKRTLMEISEALEKAVA